MNSVTNNEKPSGPASGYSEMGKRAATALAARGCKNARLNSLTRGLTSHPRRHQKPTAPLAPGGRLFAAHSGHLCPVDAFELTYVGLMAETAWFIRRGGEIECRSLANAIGLERRSSLESAPGLASKLPAALLTLYAIEKLTF